MATSTMASMPLSLFITGGSMENFSCANIWNMLETTALLDTGIQGQFSVKNPFLPTFFFSDS